MKLLRTYAPPIFVTLYFLAFTWSSLTFFFSPDDLMNIYQAWDSPTATPLIQANLLFFKPSLYPRPLSALTLRLLYTTFGFHATAFHVLHALTLIANIFLTYSLARRLGGSKTVGAMAALLIAYHTGAPDLYFNTGFIFDVQCYFFYVAAALIYVKARHDGRYPRAWELAACSLLYICALNSKELAVSLPVFLLLYEVFYFKIQRSEILRRATGLILIGILTLAMIGGRVLRSELITESAYKPHYTFHQWMLTSTAFAGDLFLRPGPVKPWMIIAIYLAMLGIAIALRSRTLGFAWVFLMLAPLPIAFIPPRGLPQYYLPLFGWALYAAMLINMATWPILRRIHPRNPPRARIYTGAIANAILTLLLSTIWLVNPHEAVALTIEGETIRSMTRQLRSLAPKLEPHHDPNIARLMFLNDPLAADSFDMTFLVRLGYRNRQTVIECLRRMPAPPTPAELATFDYVFDYRGGHAFLLPPPWTRAHAPAVILQDGQPEIFHEGWQRVNRSHPAQPGEKLILKAMDLGETVPPIAAGEKFPTTTDTPIVSVVSARIYGLPVTVASAAGWPGEIFYRIDVQLPERLPSGRLWLDVSVNGATGPPVEIPVK